LSLEEVLNLLTLERQDEQPAETDEDEQHVSVGATSQRKPAEQKLISGGVAANCRSSKCSKSSGSIWMPMTRFVGRSSLTVTSSVRRAGRSSSSMTFAIAWRTGCWKS